MTEHTMKDVDRQMRAQFEASAEQHVTPEDFVCPCCEERQPLQWSFQIAEVFVCDDCYSGDMSRLAALVNPRYLDLCREKRALEKFHDAVLKKVKSLRADLKSVEYAVDWPHFYGSLAGTIDGADNLLQAELKAHQPQPVTPAAACEPADTQ